MYSSLIAILLLVCSESGPLKVVGARRLGFVTSDILQNNDNVNRSWRSRQQQLGPSQSYSRRYNTILNSSNSKDQRDFDPHILLESIADSNIDTNPKDQKGFDLNLLKHIITDNNINTQQLEREEEVCTIQRRQFLAVSMLIATTITTGAQPSNALSKLTEKVNYMQSPINKRSGVTLSEPERTYPLSFITYLSRFLLVFDDECQQFWYTQAQAIPPKSTKDEVESIRLQQFGQFAASVEVGLIDFEDTDGPTRLIDSLVKRYGPASSNSTDSTTVTTTSTTDSSLEYNQAKRKARKSKEALRQIALLFSLITKDQPVDCITQILAADDDACIETIEMMDSGAGYPPPGYTTPNVVFPDPPTMGTDFDADIAKGVAIMKESGRILKIELTQGGRGYVSPPQVTISYPEGESLPASANAILGKKKQKGTVEKIELINPGKGYTSSSDITVTISPPDGEAVDGVTATAKAVLEYEVAGINITSKGTGYAAERAINIEIDPPPGGAKGTGGSRSAFAVSYPRGKSTSYESFIGPDNASAIRSSLSNVDTSQWIAGKSALPFFDSFVTHICTYLSSIVSLYFHKPLNAHLPGPTSTQLLALLPSGFGVQYNDALGRYVLSRSSSLNNMDEILDGSLEGQQFKAVNPVFGFRGRSPIEREKKLDLSKVLRFMASGAICSSIAHFSLTPIDVVKTKVQTQPDKYDGGMIATFKKVAEEEGLGTFFDGWEPTFVGFFFSGAFGFFLSEFFRRYYSSLVVSVLKVSEINAPNVISSLEIPLIVAGAATAAFFCCFLLAPFDAVRIRTVSQPDYAPNIFGVVSRMVEEEGVLSLFSAVPVWWAKEIPFNVFKFLVFDTSTEYLYEQFPAAQEDIRLSLLVSLVGGTLGGIAATIVSNPADVVVSELKKSKTDMTAWEAVDILKERAGVSAFAKGMGLRMIFYSLLVSLQFFLYDTVRIILGVGADDMKLYLNVLEVALNERIKQ